MGRTLQTSGELLEMARVFRRYAGETSQQGYRIRMFTVAAELERRAAELDRASSRDEETYSGLPFDITV